MRRLMLAAALLALPALAQAYSFNVTNKNELAIVAIEVSETGETFDKISDAPVKAGESASFDWNKGESRCEVFVRVLYEDGSASEETKYDLCKDNAQIEVR